MSPIEMLVGPNSSLSRFESQKYKAFDKNVTKLTNRKSGQAREEAAPPWEWFGRIGPN